jgi:DNA-binding YbaB/EbfC family protein
MDIQKMMRQAQKVQQQMAEAQEKLAEKTVEASVGGGKVTVVANGAGDVISIKISPDVVDPEDVEMLEDLVLSGVVQAIADSKKMQASEMGKLTAGLGLPPGLGF